jgi:hypothetical protein
MFVFKISTTRPDTNFPFFVNAAQGQVYESLMLLSRGTRPTDGPDRIVSIVQTESADRLSLTTEYKFNSVKGKDALFDDFESRTVSQGLDPVFLARVEYNETVGHTSVVTFEKEDENLDVL